MRLMAFDVSCVLFVVATCFGEDPNGPVQKAPQPIEIQVMPRQTSGNLFIAPQAPMYEHGTRDYWYNYGVDATGHYRPRVIMSPNGDYYFYDLSSYPWLTTHSTSMSKYELD